MEKLPQRIVQINLVLLASQMIIIALVWRFLPPEIPLFFSRPWGKDQLVAFPGIIILPAICLVVVLANFVLARLAAKQEVLLKQTLLFASFIFTLLLTISLVQIIRLIF